MIKLWQFRFSGETETREISYGEFEAFLESLPLPSKWPFSKRLEDIRDLKLKRVDTLTTDNNCKPPSQQGGRG